MASCGDTLLPCSGSSISDSDSNSSRCTGSVPVSLDGQSLPNVSPKLAWGGAGIFPSVLGNKSKHIEWAPSPKTLATASFRDIQSEDLAREMDMKSKQELDQQQARFNLSQLENMLLSSPSPHSNSAGVADCSSDVAGCSSNTAAVEGQDTTDNDFLLAQMLQYEYDVVHDLEVERNQRHANKNSKLSISYNNYKLLPSFASEGCDVLHQDDDPIDEIEAGEQDEPLIPPCGYVQHEGAYVTKHDPSISARRNTKKMLNLLPLGVNTGDAGGFTINMPNKVFNNLSASINSDNRRKQRQHDKVERGTLGSHLDNSTSLKLLSLVTVGLLQELLGVISTGKESVVYQAVVGSIEAAEPDTPCVVKVFKTRLAEFKTRERYIRDDHRFKDRMTKTNNYTNIKLWVEKEYRNLCRIHSAGLRCPAPLMVRDNLLVMSLIGSPEVPASQIRNVNLSRQNWEDAYNQTLQIVRDLTNTCRLVHADLSEYNLLYDDGQVYVIDLAQAVDITHPSALSYLYRDLCNVANFFRRHGVCGVRTGLELLEDITGLDIRRCASNTNTEQIAAAEQELDMWRGSDCYDDSVYEFLWNTAQMRNQLMQNCDVTSDEVPNNEQLMELTLHKSGNAHKEQWITKKTDSFVTNKGQKKKKKTRKNSGSKSSSDKTEDSAAVADGSASAPLEMDESTGFCLVNGSDCAESVSDAAEQSTDVGTELTPRQKVGQRVRFDVEDTDTVDTEDYNADADTDDLGADTDDLDTDVTATDQDGGDTEGYHGDADDTDTNVNGVNHYHLHTQHHHHHQSSCSRKGKEVVKSDLDDSSDQQNALTTAEARGSKGSPLDKRSCKKKNKKCKTKGCSNV